MDIASSFASDLKIKFVGLDLAQNVQRLALIPWGMDMMQ